MGETAFISGESTMFQVSNEVVKESFSHWKYCIIGGILADKGLSNEAFRVTMSQAFWVQFRPW